MRIVIFGTGGMVGRRVWLRCRDRCDADVILHSRPAATPGGNLFDLARTLERLDLTNDAAFDDAFRWAGPAAVVTAASPVKQRPGGQGPIAAAALNALPPHGVATHCRAVATRPDQVSTDFVFAGHRDGYCETEAPGPPDVPGCAKLLGKLATLEC